MAFSILSKKIGSGSPCFVIAEAGVNHNGDLSIAKKLIDVACQSGADAVKFQTFVANSLASKDAPTVDYQKKNDARFNYQTDLLRDLELSPDDFSELSNYCREKGIIFLSTPFDLQSVSVLESLNVPAYKVPSGEITNTPLLREIARKHKPVIISTGMTTLDEIRAAIKIFEQEGNSNLALLHCITSYPAPFSELNLNAIRTLGQFGFPVGYSDHSEGILAPVLAVALGATIIEKHFTLDKNMQGPDHKCSLEPSELTEMVAKIKLTQSMLGSGIKIPTPYELSLLPNVRKGIFAARDLVAGEVLAPSDLVTKRPVCDIPAENFDSLVGKLVLKNLKKGQPLNFRDISK